METSAILTIARQELIISIRNKWTVIFAAIFGLLVMAISYFGTMASGELGFQGFNRTSASLLSLVLYLIPLIALMMGSQSFTAGSGDGELLFSQPVTRTEVMLGKVAGLFASLTAATLGGFGIGGIMISMQTGSDEVWGYAVFVGLSLLLSLVFLSIAVLISMVSGRQTKAFGLALVVWFVFVIFYDLLVMGGSLLFRERAANYFIFLSLFGNPVDMVRVAGLIALNGEEIFGPAGAALIKFAGGSTAGGAALLTSLFAWVAVPLFASLRLLKKQDI
jgi:Cu-processing system permease protein